MTIIYYPHSMCRKIIEKKRKRSTIFCPFIISYLCFRTEIIDISFACFIKFQSCSTQLVKYKLYITWTEYQMTPPEKTTLLQSWLGDKFVIRFRTMEDCLCFCHTNFKRYSIYVYNSLQRVSFATKPYIIAKKSLPTYVNYMYEDKFNLLSKIISSQADIRTLWHHITSCVECCKYNLKKTRSKTKENIIHKECSVLNGDYGTYFSNITEFCNIFIRARTSSELFIL